MGTDKDPLSRSERNITVESATILALISALLVELI